MNSNIFVQNFIQLSLNSLELLRKSTYLMENPRILLRFHKKKLKCVYSTILGFFHQPAHPHGEFFWAPCNHAHLSAADPSWIRRPWWILGGIYSYLYKWMEQVSAGNQFYLSTHRGPPQIRLPGSFAAGCKILILFIASPTLQGWVGWWKKS